MPTPQKFEIKFWKSLRSDMTMMLGLQGVADGHTRPMTAQLDGDELIGDRYGFSWRDRLGACAVAREHQPRHRYLLR